MMVMVSALRRAAELIAAGPQRNTLALCADDLEKAIRDLVHIHDVQLAAEALARINGLWAAGMRLHEEYLHKPVYTIKAAGLRRGK